MQNHDIGNCILCCGDKCMCMQVPPTGARWLPRDKFAVMHLCELWRNIVFIEHVSFEHKPLVFRVFLNATSATKHSGLWWRWSGNRLITTTCPQEIRFVVLMLSKRRTDHLKNKVLDSCNGHPLCEISLIYCSFTRLLWLLPDIRVAIWNKCFHYKGQGGQCPTQICKIHCMPGVKLPSLIGLLHNLLPTCSLKVHHPQPGRWVSIGLALTNLQGHVFCHGALEIEGGHGGLHQSSKACPPHVARLHDMKNCWHEETLE